MNANTVLESCESTNDIAKKLAENGAPSGTWISARKQTCGKGRQGNRWESESGNLFLSVVSRPSPASFLKWATWTPLAGSIGVARALKKMFSSLEITVKWPNDLEIHGRKLAGVLCESVSGGGAIVIGIGLNCLIAPKNLERPVVSLTEALGRPIGADQVRDPILIEVANAINDLDQMGPLAIRRDYERWASLPNGTQVKWSPAPGKEDSGTVEGLGDLAEIWVTTREGKRMRLLAEEVKAVRSRGDEFRF